MSTNLTPFSSDGGFVTAGNITTAVSASPAPTISGFSSVSADNFRLMSGTISGGFATVVDDGINSIAQAPGAQMDVFGFPFSGGGVRGQLTISDVTTPSEANGTWYYQSINTYTYQIYTDSTYSILVDATGWSAYTGGGTVAITRQVPAANIVINSNGYFSKFDNTGDLTLPGDLLMANNASITTTNATGNVVGKTINIRAGAADQGDYYATAGGNLNLIGGLGAGNDGGGGGPGGAVNITSGVSADVAGHAGNVTINTGSNTWTFDYNGIATLPGEGILQSIDDTVTLRSFNTSTGNANSVYLGSSGGLGFNDQEAGGNWLEIFRNGTEPQITVPVGRGNLYIQTASGNTPYNWTFGDTGNLTLPGNTFAVNYANGTAVSLGGGSSYGNAEVATFLGAYGSNTVSTTGNVTSGNILTSGRVSATGNIVTGGQIQSSAFSGGNISWTVANQTDFQGAIKVGGTGVIKGPGGASSITLNNNGANIPILGVTNTGNSTSTTTGVLIVSGGAGIAGNVYIGGIGNVTGNLTVNGTGGVSTPNLPAFRVYGNGVTAGLTTTTNTTGILNGNNWAVDYNQGSYLNSTTGLFTAPVAGLYQVNLVARCANNAAPTAQVMVVKNYGSANTTQAMWEVAANTTVNHFGVSTVSKLAVGDTLAVRVTVGEINFDENDNWSVAFLG